MSISLAESPLAPDYDRSAMSTGIVHIGVGGFHRAHEAAYLDRLMRRRAGTDLREGAGSASSEGSCLDWGICGVGVLERDQARGRVTIDEGWDTSALVEEVRRHTAEG